MLYGIQLRAILQEMLMNLIHNMLHKKSYYLIT